MSTSAVNPKRAFRRTRARRGIPAGFLPMYVWSVLLTLLPLLYVVLLSFMKQDRVNGFAFSFTLENYVRLGDPMYAGIIGRSLRLAAETTALTFVIGYSFSYCMSRLGDRARGVVMLLIIIPFWTNSLLRTGGIITLLAGNGVVNSLLMQIGLTDAPLSLLYTYGATLLGMVYSLIPFMILPTYTSLEKLDNSLLEAARDLGAGKIRTFFTVTLPVTLPGILSGCVLVFVPSIGMYFITDLLGGANVTMIGNAINTQIHAVRNWPFAAALSVLMIAMSLIFIALYRGFTGKSELEGIAV